MRVADHDHSSDGEEETARGKVVLCMCKVFFHWCCEAVCGFYSSSSSICQIIEKRRRDRINNSLLELRRLVPTAFEKQVNKRNPLGYTWTLRRSGDVQSHRYRTGWLSKLNVLPHQVKEVKIVTNRYHHQTSPGDYLH